MFYQLKHHFALYKKIYLETFILFIIIAAIKVNFVSQPLIGDESYYAIGGIFDNFKFAIQETFGHPIGWLLINNLFFEIFGHTHHVAHLVAIFTNSALMSILYFCLRRSFSSHFQILFLMSLIALNEYFVLFSHISHPVIAMSLSGIISLLFLNTGRYRLFAFWLLVSLAIRESALVFVIAAILTVPNLKTCIASLPGLLFLGICYFWHFLIEGSLLLNSQAKTVYQNEGSMHVMDLSHAFEYFYNNYLSNQTNLFLLIFSTLATLFFQKKLYKNKFFQQMITIFIIHGGFFAFYLDTALRNTFLNMLSLYIISFMCLRCFSIKFKKSAYLIGTAIAFSAIHGGAQYFDSLNNNKLHSEHLKSLSIKLSQIMKNSPGSEVLSTNPLTDYFELPYMGYVEEPLRVRWHGGVKGLTKLKLTKFIVVPENWLDNFATRELKEHVKLNNYLKIYTEDRGGRLSSIYIKE
ncbi:MAG: hypothetical protein CME64_14925 [Halobacteriovoraceae bacterium]|nr:hypothetical protein [Halobacteriovoraceae bacterium]|tara:strand:- start:31053 stop:32447 length:1395 start_codon:yes stop_codon:yes gene_type:complete